MTVFKHDTHTAHVIKNGRGVKTGIVLIKNTGRKLSIRSLLRSWKFYVRIHSLKYWFVTIRLPFFYFEKDNGGFSIGTQNRYLWVIF